MIDNAVAQFRANTIALSTVAVAGILVFIALVINHSPNPDVLSGTLLGAAASAIVGLLIILIGQPDIREIPYAFLEAVREEILETGWYRLKHAFLIRVETYDSGCLKALHINITAIILARRKVQVASPRIRPPAGGEIISQSYKIGGYEKPFEQRFRIEPGVTSEETQVVYSFEESLQRFDVADDHRWSSAIDGLVFTVILPVTWDVVTLTMSDELLSEVSRRHGSEPSSMAERSFIKGEGAFSHQGVKWRIFCRQHGFNQALSSDSLDAKELPQVSVISPARQGSPAA